MKVAATATLIYALLVLTGGVMGYVQAKSVASLISGLVFGIALLGCGWFLWQGSITSGYVAGLLTIFLLLFFGYRFLSTNQFMPGGLMLILSFLALFFLLLGIFLRARNG